MQLAENFSENNIGLSSVLNSLTEGLLVLNREGKLIFSNQSSTDILNFSFDLYPTSEWADKLSIFRLNNEGPLAYHEMPIIRALMGVRLTDYRLYIKHSGLGNGVYITVNAHPLWDENGNINGAMATFQDITRSLKKEKAVKSINASKLETLGALAANIAHEINNPLSVIKTSVSALKYMLQENEPLEILFKQLNVIDTTTSRISDMARALSNLSRNTKDEMFSESSVREIIKDVNSLLDSNLTSKNIRFVLEDTDGSMDERLYCFRVQLSQVLINVFRNAVDAVEEQDERVIQLRFRKDKSSFYFLISDSGPGVPASVKKHLFEPFFTTKTIGKGTGIGLSISKEIMKKHKGEIYLDQNEGPSCFVVKIPRATESHPGNILN